jgi:PHD/YefM family antitoxin component YafN of YafNO toxin-antitoxin module
MQTAAPQLIVDEHGKRVGVILSIEDYRRLLDALEELESIQTYDGARAAADEVVPFDEAVAESKRQ